MLLVNHTDYLQLFNLRLKNQEKKCFQPNQVSPRQAACGETQGEGEEGGGGEGEGE